MSYATEWANPPQVEIPPSLHEAVGDELVAYILARRGIREAGRALSFLDPARYTPSPPSELPDMEIAARRILAALETGERIGVWGDFDVDGQTATALLVEALGTLGADAAYYIPHRTRESHGIKTEPLERFLDAGEIELLITCDTGVSEHPAIEHAAGRGVDVVVTDHHDLPPSLPPAPAVINPKRLPRTHPLYHLPGVGVAYKLVEELLTRTGRADELPGYLDLVALGIVVDVAPQVDDTRYLLQLGLKQLRQTRRAALRELISISGLDASGLTEEHVAFWIGPRLNALGRLGDANRAVQILTTTDAAQARVFAVELDGLNDRRRILSDTVRAQAEAQLEADPSLLEHGAIVLASTGWGGGVVGPVAGSLAEKYGRPAILITLDEEGVGRGSARSVPGVDIHAAICTQDELLLSHGGHPGAAGLSIRAAEVPRFRRGISEAIEKQTGGAVPAPQLQIDAFVPLSEVSMGLAAGLERLAPFGEGNPQPVLAAGGLTQVGSVTVGRARAHRRVVVADDEGREQAFLWWGGASERLPRGTFDLAYTLRVGDYRGEQTLQAVWLAAREWEPPYLEDALPSLQYVDLRGKNPAEARRAVDALRESARVQVWAEGPGAAEVGGRGRGELEPADALVVWTSPPGGDVLAEAIESVEPKQIYLCDNDPGPDSHKMQAFIERLAGMVKYTLAHRSGIVDTRALASALAHREGAVLLGIEWLAAKGMVAIEKAGEEGPVLRPGDGLQKGDPAPLQEALRDLLHETAAYRAFYAACRAEQLVP